MSTINLNQYAKVFTARLRSRAHNQAFAHSYQEMRRRAKSPAAKAATKKMDELDHLCRLQRSTFDPAMKTKGLHLYQQLPLPLSSDEDPHFVLSTRALRIAAQLEAQNHPLTFALLNHCTKHSYLLDGYSLVKLLQALRALNHPQSADALRILLPRLEQVADELTAAEAAGLLQIIAHFQPQAGIDPTAVCTRYSQLMIDTVAYLPLEELRKVLAAVPLLPAELGRSVIVAAEPALLSAIGTERRLYALLRATAGTAPADQTDETAETERKCSETAGSEEDGGAAKSSSAEADGDAPSSSTAAPSPGSSPAPTREEQLQLLEAHRAVHRLARRGLLSLEYDPQHRSGSNDLRRLMNEMVRAVLDMTVVDRATADASANVPAAPSGMVRSDVCETARLLHLASYRHVPALQRLASRYLTMTRHRRVQATRQAPHQRAAEELREVCMIIEALGFFVVPMTTRSASPTATGALHGLVVMLNDEAKACAERCLQGDQASRLTTLACVSRALRSVAQLGRGEAFQSSAAAAAPWRTNAATMDEATLPEPTATASSSSSTTPTRPSSPVEVFSCHIIPSIDWMWDSPTSVLQRYIRSSTCHRDPQRSARLLRRLAEVCLVLQPSSDKLVLPDTDGGSQRVAPPPQSASEEGSKTEYWRSAKAARRVMEGLSKGIATYYKGMGSHGGEQGRGGRSEPAAPPSDAARRAVDAQVREDLTAVLQALERAGCSPSWKAEIEQIRNLAAG
eukprot:gene1515-900_t